MEATEKPVAIKWSPDGCGWAGFSEMRSSPRSRFYVVGPTRSMLRGAIFHSFLFPRDLQLPKDKEIGAFGPTGCPNARPACRAARLVSRLASQQHHRGPRRGWQGRNRVGQGEGPQAIRRGRDAADLRRRSQPAGHTAHTCGSGREATRIRERLTTSSKVRGPLGASHSQQGHRPVSFYDSRRRAGGANSLSIWSS